MPKPSPQDLTEVAATIAMGYGDDDIDEPTIRAGLMAAGIDPTDETEARRLRSLVKRSVEFDQAEELASLGRHGDEARLELGEDASVAEVLERATELAGEEDDEEADDADEEESW